MTLPAAVFACSVLWLPLAQEGGADAESSTNVLELPVEWKVGTKYRLEQTKEREDLRAGKLTVRKGRVFIDVVVKSRNEVGHVFQWNYGDVEVLSEGGSTEKIAQDLVDLQSGFVMQMQTDEFGTPQAIVNLKEVLAQARQAMTLVEEGLLDQPGATPELVQAFKSVADPLLEPANFQMMALKDPMILYFPSGGSYELGVPSSYEDVLPNPMGGPPFPTKAHLLLEKWNRDQGKAQIKWQQKFDEAKVQDVMKETLRIIARRMGGKELPEGDLPPFSIEDDATYRYDANTGIPISMTYERTVKSGGDHRIERVTYRRVGPGGGGP